MSMPVVHRHIRWMNDVTDMFGGELVYVNNLGKQRNIPQSINKITDFMVWFVVYNSRKTERVITLLGYAI